MTISCSGKLIIKCDSCKHLEKFNCNNLDFQIVETQQRQMGSHNTHVYKNEYTCHSCSNQIGIEYTVWEYPVGTFNDSEVAIDGGELVEECNCAFTEKLHS